MAHMSRNIFVLFLLCVVLLIIVGVAFPSYLSRKNIKIRSILNSSAVTFNVLSSEKLISKGLEADNINNKNESTFLSRKNKIATEINISYGITNLSLTPINVKRRSKRQTSPDNKSDLFDWNFNINVTSYRKTNESKSKDLNVPVKRSGVAVYLESREPKKIAFNEMQAAFKSVKSFFRDFFEVSFENSTKTKENKVQYFTEYPRVDDNETNHSLDKSSQTSVPISSEKIDKLKSQSGNESLSQTDREARIFFGLFNLGGNSLQKTTPEQETNLITEDTNGNILINKNLPETLPHEDSFVTNSQHLSSIETDSFRYGTDRSKIDQNEQNIGKSDLLSVTQQADCRNCNTDKTENTILSNEKDSSISALKTTREPTDHLTDKTLRNLCIQILSNLKESQTPFSEGKKALETQFISSQNLPIVSPNSPIANGAEDLYTHIEIDDNIFVSSEESPTENITSGKQARFLNIFGLGSGRSEIINEGNIIFEKEPDEPKFTNLPSASDCKKISENWRMPIDPKQNHTLDSNTQSIHEFLENNTNSVSKNAINEFNTDENRTLFSTEVISDINKDLQEVKSEKNTEEHVSSSELKESQVIDLKQKIEDTTDGQRDGRIFSFFDFGSGNGRDANMTNRFFGSESESLNSSDFDDSNDSRNGVLFQDVSVDGDYSSEKDTLEHSVTSAQEHRFLEIFGIGSGNGREIVDSTDSEIEYDDCENDCSHRETREPYECNDNCVHENYDVTNSSVEFLQTDSKSDCEGNCNASIVEKNEKDFEFSTNKLFGLETSSSESSLLTKTSGTKDISNEATEDGCDDCYENFITLKPVTETEAPSYITEPTEQTEENTYIINLNYHSTDKIDYKQNTENSVIEHGTTEKKIRRFMGTVFLTGSGDGNLFGDDGGPINLVEEENTIISNRNPRRRGRLDDTGHTDFFGISQNPFDSSVENPLSPLYNPQDLDSLIGRPEDTFEPVQSGTEDFSPNITFLPSPNITKNLIPFQSQTCSAARDCNNTLNERCITVSASSICDCGRSFVRHKETGKCVAKRFIETSLRLPEEKFHEDLRNPDSSGYKQMSEKSIETIYLLLNETPDILRVVIDINVAGFESGSLIIKFNLILVAEKDNPQNLKSMKNELEKALEDDNVLEKAALNVRDASFQFFKTEINLCKSPELNYCSKYADCLWNKDFPEGYSCKCKEHYIDVSTNSLYPGEICLAKCPASFCGTNGHCEVLGNDKRHCICYGLYFGERCEYPGVVILGSLLIVALVSLIVVFVVIFKLRCRSSNCGRTPTFRRADTPGHAIANCRVSDAIALGESREMKVAKFTQISTPVPEPPLIKVTRPTLNESSISFDCDSTFDVSNNSNEKTV